MMLPSFLVVGAMKSGTTTLYEDLRVHPSVFLPEKELALLLEPDIASDGGITRYQALFSGATEGQVVGDVSSPYAKLPESAPALRHAQQILGSQFRVIYIVRNPVDRLVSQHHHESSRGRMSSSIDEAVRQAPALTNYSKYAYQISPWSQIVGSSRVRVVRFEDYVANRVAGLAAVLQFLSIHSRVEEAGVSRSHNVSIGQHVGRGPVGRVAASSLYRKRIRPLLPAHVRSLSGRMLLPKAGPRPSPPHPDTVEWIISQVVPGLDRLGSLCDTPPPSWDFGATRLKYEELYRQYRRA